MLVPGEKRYQSLLSVSVVSLLTPGRILVVLSFFLLVTLLFQPASALAQDPTADEDVIRVSTDLLLFPVRIRDKRGNNVEGLKESDLSLRDKDHAVTGLYFSSGADRVALVFALDQSGSLREIISQQRDAALGLFSRFGDKSSIAVLRFAEAPSLVAPFGRDPEVARAAFSFGAGANQHTAIFDAAAKAVTTFDQTPTDRLRVRSERRIVILISDGLDNASHSKASAVIESALEKRVSFYVIHLPLFEPRDGRLAVRPPARGFRDLAEKTGGKYFLTGDSRSALQPNRSVDLTPVFQAIEADLKSQYLLGFYISGSARDGRRHRFSLSLVPPNIEYSVGRLGYSRTHEFYVDLPAGATKLPN